MSLNCRLFKPSIFQLFLSPHFSSNLSKNRENMIFLVFFHSYVFYFRSFRSPISNYELHPFSDHLSKPSQIFKERDVEAWMMSRTWRLETNNKFHLSMSWRHFSSITSQIDNDYLTLSSASITVFTIGTLHRCYRSNSSHGTLREFSTQKHCLFMQFQGH